MTTIVNSETPMPSDGVATTAASEAIRLRSNLLSNLAAFMLFALYGPAFELFGQLRYVEIAVLIFLFVNAHRAWSYVDRLTKILIALLIITALSQILSDMVNGVYADSTIKRVGTYVIFIAILIACKLLSLAEWSRLRWILAGYCLSWVFIYFVGTTAAEYYQDNPWRLGLGWAFTLAICLGLSLLPRLYLVAMAILLPVAALHIVLGARSIAIFTLFVFAASSYAALFGKPIASKVTARRFFVVIGVLSLGIAAGYQSIIWATEKRILPAEVQERTEAQVYSLYGLAATARPETAASLTAIAERPVLGWGSTAYDPMIWRYYIDLLTANWRSRVDYRNIYEDTFYQEWEGGLPSHSHFFGAWVDGGFFASLSWLLVLIVSILAIMQGMTWRHPITPAVIFIASTTIWDVLFSPGPHRMDMALRLTLLTFVLTFLANARTAAAKAEQTDN